MSSSPPAGDPYGAPQGRPPGQQPYPPQQGYPQQGYPQQGPPPGYQQPNYYREPPGDGDAPGYGDAPGHWGGAPAVPEEPSTIRTAFLLWVAALALYVVGQIVQLLFPPSAEDYADYFSSLGIPPDAQSDALAATQQASGVLSIVGLVVTLLFVALFAWFGLKMRAGATWARITTAVLAGLGILATLGTAVFTLVTPVPVAGGRFGIALSVLSGLLLVGYLVFLFMGPSNQWFAAHSARP